MPTWTPQRHGTGANLLLNAGLRASVDYEASERLPYEAPHFNVTVLGVRLKGRSETMDEAKVRAESALRAALTTALEQLG
jgi:hypothetical protein